MFFRRIVAASFVLAFCLVLATPLLAQMRKVQAFKNVNIAHRLKHEDTIIEKGQYDLEIMAYRTVRQWILKVMKGRKALCAVTGEILREECPGARGQDLEEVPEKPTIRMQLIPEEQTLYIIFESGLKSPVYPCYKVRFQTKYETDIP